jgi:tRNA threonylcarbamoyladenosine biosynthesis protein TsaB
MTAVLPPALAISASNCTGDAAFSLALRHRQGLTVVNSGAVTGSGPRQDLATLAQQLCADAGVAASELQELRVDRGPGSYTGLRIAVTFARTLHAFGGARMLACTSFELLALAALCHGAPAGAVLRPVLDGRRARFLTAALQVRDGALAFVSPPRALALAELQATLQRDDIVLWPAPLLPPLADAAASRGALLQPATPVTADLLFAPQLAAVPVTLPELEPLYLLASYAE